MDLTAALSFAKDRRNGVLVTLKRDGRPQLSNIAYALGDDGRIRVSVTADRAKTKNLQRDTRASLYIPGDNFWSYVVVEGTAEVTPVATAPDDATVDELVALYRSVGGEHPDWAEYRAAMVHDRRLVVRLVADHAYGMVNS